MTANITKTNAQKKQYPKVGVTYHRITKGIRFKLYYPCQVSVCKNKQTHCFFFVFVFVFVCCFLPFFWFKKKNKNLRFFVFRFCFDMFVLFCKKNNPQRPAWSLNPKEASKGLAEFSGIPYFVWYLIGNGKGTSFVLFFFLCFVFVFFFFLQNIF